MERRWKIFALAILVMFIGSMLLPLAEPGSAQQEPEWLFTLNYVYNTEIESQLKIGQIIKEAYAEIGVNLELQGYDPSTFFTRTISQPGPVITTFEEGGYDVCYMGYTMQIPDMIWYIGCYNTEGINPYGWNFWAWDDGTANMLLRDAMGTYDFTERREKAWAWQQRHQEDVGTIVLYHLEQYVYHRADVANYSLIAYHRYYDYNYLTSPRDTFRVNYRGTVNQLNPFFLDGGYLYLLPMYRLLYTVWFDGQAWIVVPDLAAGVPEYSEDGLTAIIRLKDSNGDGVVDVGGNPVKWHDGEPFTAKDVEYTYNAIIHPDTAGTFAGDLGAAIESVEVIDSTTLKVNLKKISPELPSLLATPGALLMPEHVLGDIPYSELKTHETNTKAPAPGLGPYKFVSWTEGAEMVTEAFEDYYEQVNIPKMVVTFIMEASTLRAALEAGELDCADGGIDPADYDAMVDNPDIVVERASSNGFTFFPLNHEHPILSNRYVRRALAWAIPYDKLIDMVEYGRAYRSNGPIEKGMWFWNPDAMYYEYDLDKARDNLRLAGYPEWPPPVEEVPVTTNWLAVAGGVVAGIIVGFAVSFATMRRRTP